MFSYIKKNDVSYIVVNFIPIPRFIPIPFRHSVPRFIPIPFRFSVPRFIPIPFRFSVPRFIPIPFRFSVPFRHSVIPVPRFIPTPQICAISNIRNKIMTWLNYKVAFGLPGNFICFTLMIPYVDHSC